MTTTEPARDTARPVAPDVVALRDLSGRALLALAERHDAAGRQDGLDAARAEAERRAADQPASSLAAQLAGYIGLLAEDAEHVLADEAHAWSAALRRMLPRDSRMYRTELLVCALGGWVLHVDDARIAATTEALSNGRAHAWARRVLGEGVRFEPVLIDAYAEAALVEGRAIDWVANPTPVPPALPGPRAYADAAVRS